MTKMPQSSMKSESPCFSLAKSQIVAGSQMSGGPKGMTAKKKVSTESRTAPGMPAMVKPMPATMACAIAVPRMP